MARRSCIAIFAEGTDFLLAPFPVIWSGAQAINGLVGWWSPVAPFQEYYSWLSIDVLNHPIILREIGSERVEVGFEARSVCCISVLAGGDLQVTWGISDWRGSGNHCCLCGQSADYVQCEHRRGAQMTKRSGF